MDKAGYGAYRCGRFDKRMDGLARRHVDDCGADLEPGVTEYFRGCIEVFLPQISQQDVLARADPPRDRLTDRSGTDKDDNVGHGKQLNRFASTDKSGETNQERTSR